MKNTFKILLTLMFALISVAEEAQQPPANAPCEFSVTKFGVTRVVTYDGCMLQVTRDDPNGGERFRIYNLNRFGQFLVFVDTRDGKTNSSSTGARAYQIFPLSEISQPEVKDIGSNQIRISSAAGVVADFDVTSGDVTRIQGFSIKVDPVKRLSEMGRIGGGVNIKNLSGILVDFGWAQGASPIENPERKVILTNAEGTTCIVPMRAYVDYGDEPEHVLNEETVMRKDPKTKSVIQVTVKKYKDSKPRYNGGRKKGMWFEPVLRIKTNDDMAALLKKQCPALRNSLGVYKPVAPEAVFEETMVPIKKGRNQ